MMNISLPEQIKAFINEQAGAAGFTVSEYIYRLVLREQERMVQQKRVESLLLDGLESGEPIEVTEEWWEQKYGQLLAQVSQQES
jgi:antitoxin ParD1/3/4